MKWEPTWEPAESLTSCQNLIDEFWSFVNHAKKNEARAQEHRKRVSCYSRASYCAITSGHFERSFLSM